MMTKEQMLKLAKKCGARIYSSLQRGAIPEQIVFTPETFAAYTSAIEEKYQAQVAMLRNGLEKLACLGNGDKHGNSTGNLVAISLLNATQATSDAFIAEVKARALEEAAKRFEAMLIGELTNMQERLVAKALRKMAAELRAKTEGNGK